MLKSFKVSGFASISEPVSLNFMAKKHQKINGTIYKDNYFENKIAKSVVLFGGNATGKTNILRAIHKIYNIIKQGLDFSDVNNIERYELEFIINKALYSYILEFSSEKLIYEKLSKNNEQIYEFKNDKLNYPNKSGFEQIFSVISKDTILHKLSDNNIEEIVILINECKNESFWGAINMFDIIVEYGTKVSYIPFPKYEKEYLDNHRDKVLEIVKILDDSIDDYNFVAIDDNIYALKIKRKSKLFNLEKESSGITKIFNIIMGLLLNLETNSDSIMLIDELDSSISTNSLIRLLNGFVNSIGNINAQFIITSHNPLIFDTDMLNPMQIYIVGKEDCKTTIKCLDEFELRNDKRKAYLNYLRGDYE